MKSHSHCPPTPTQKNTLEDSSTHMKWKIVLKMPPHGPAFDPVRSPASLLWSLPVKVEPDQIRDVNVPVVVYNQHHHDPNAHLSCKRGTGQVGSSTSHFSCNSQPPAMESRRLATVGNLTVLLRLYIVVHVPMKRTCVGHSLHFQELRCQKQKWYCISYLSIAVPKRHNQVNLEKTVFHLRLIEVMVGEQGHGGRNS